MEERCRSYPVTFELDADAESKLKNFALAFMFLSAILGGYLVSLT